MLVCRHAYMPVSYTHLGITEATNMVTSYFDPGTKLIYAIGAVVGLIGGIKVYNLSLIHICAGIPA